MTKYRFTDRWLRSPTLTPTAGRVEFADDLCPGLHLRVTIQGTRTFSAMFRVNGKLIRQTIGRYPRVSLSNARASALDMMRSAQDGADARERRSRAPSTVTYEELVEAYTEKHLKVNARSWRNINRGLTSKRMAPFLKRPAAAITPGVTTEPQRQRAKIRKSRTRILMRRQRRLNRRRQGPQVAESGRSALRRG